MSYTYKGLVFPEYKTGPLAYDPQDALTKVSFPNYNTNTVDTPVLPQNNPSWFSGLASPTWQGIGSTLQGIGGLANAYMGYKQYGLAKDAFGFQKKAFNRNIENQGKTLNNEIASRARVGLAMTAMSPGEKAAKLDSIIEKRLVNTDPIK